MSKAYGLHCDNCKATSPCWFNHGDAILAEMVEAWPVVKQVRQTPGYGGWWGIAVMGVHDLPDPFDWLSEHDGHEVRVIDEYDAMRYEGQ